MHWEADQLNPPQSLSDIRDHRVMLISLARLYSLETRTLNPAMSCDQALENGSIGYMPTHLMNAVDPWTGGFDLGSQRAQSLWSFNPVL